MRVIRENWEISLYWSFSLSGVVAFNMHIFQNNCKTNRFSHTNLPWLLYFTYIFQRSCDYLLHTYRLIYFIYCSIYLVSHRYVEFCFDLKLNLI